MRDWLKSKGGRLSAARRPAGIAFLAATLLLLCNPLGAQTQTFTMEDIDFVLELPSPEWRVISRLDVHNRVEFINGTDTGNGYLRLRKMRGPAGTTAAADLFSYQETWELQSLTGYVVCSNGKGEPFNGRLNGAAFSYEYVSNGKGMDGRIYYLQIDSRTFYALHFTVASAKLQGFRNQMDSIARSFRLK